MIVVVLLGPPGSGKGTQARLLSRATSFPFVSTGDMVRESIRSRGPESAKLRKFIVEGVLVPDEILIPRLISRLKQELHNHGGAILDGVPRNVAQAETIERFLESSENSGVIIIWLDVSEETLEKRILRRRICTRCQAPTGYPGSPPFCEYCGGVLTKRQDDTVSALKTRLEEYKAHTRPLLSFYENRGVLLHVRADTPIHTVLADILNKLETRLLEPRHST